MWLFWDVGFFPLSCGTRFSSRDAHSSFLWHPPKPACSPLHALAQGSPPPCTRVLGATGMALGPLQWG